MKWMVVVVAVVGCGKEAKQIGPPPVAEITDLAVKAAGRLSFDLAFVQRDAKHQAMLGDASFSLIFEQSGNRLCKFDGGARPDEVTAAGVHMTYELPTTVACGKLVDHVPVTLTITSDYGPGRATIEVPDAIRDMLPKLTGPVPVDASVPPDVLPAPAPNAADPAQLAADLASFPKLVDAVPMPGQTEPARACPELPQAFDPPAASIYTLQRLAGRKAPPEWGRMALLDSEAIAVLAAHHDGTSMPAITPAVLRQLDSGRKLMFVYQWKTFTFPHADQLDEVTHEGTYRPGRADGFVILMDTAKRVPLCWFAVDADSSQQFEVTAKYNKLDAAQRQAELDFISNLMPELYTTRRTLVTKQQLVPENADLEARWRQKAFGSATDAH